MPLTEADLRATRSFWRGALIGAVVVAVAWWLA
jgi:hypothetical protein